MLFSSFCHLPVCVHARRYLAGLGLLGLAFVAQASVVITGTRIIYPAPAREVSVQIKNVGAVPALVQVWLDRGDDSAQPGSAAAQTPFVLTPPIARLEPKRGQTIRLVYSGEEILPADRESLFYFNLLDIPPKPTDASEQVAERNMLQLAVRSRLKLFYRPEALKKLSSDAAWKQLVWRVVTDKNGAVALELENPSPFHVNVQRVDALSQGAVLPAADALLKERAQGASEWTVTLPVRSGQVVRVAWEDGQASLAKAKVTIDPATGHEVSVRATPLLQASAGMR